MLALAGAKVHSIIPTRITAESATSLDIIAVDKGLVCEEYKVLNVAASDHLPVTAIVKLHPGSPLKPVVKRSFRRVDFDELDGKIRSIELPTDRSLDVNYILESWHAQVMSIFDVVAPLKPFPWRRNKLPWLTDEIQELIEKRDGTLARLTKPDLTHPAKMILVDELKVLRKQVKSRIRRSIKDEGVAALAKNDHKGAWRYIKAASFKTDKSKEYYLDAATLNDYFASIIHSPMDAPVSSTSSCDSADCFSFSSVSLVAVERALSGTRANTATGPDDIPGAVVKKLAAAMSVNICQIFNLSFNSNTLPSQWKKANVTPVWKGKGCKSHPSNYRPISILPVLARTLEKIAANQLNSYCNARSVIPVEQYGF